MRTARNILAAPYIPTGALAGGEPGVLRGENMLLRGNDASSYFECFGGLKSLNETVPSHVMVGTLSWTAGDPLINGTGTSFIADLHIGQKVLTGGEVFVVEEIISDLQFRSNRPPFTTDSGQSGERLPIMWEMGNRRVSQIWGNVLEFDRGNIVGIGDGSIRVNGEELPGQSLTLTRYPQVALYDADTDTYSVIPLGFFDQPAASDVSVSVVFGGTKDMAQGLYSFRWAWANTQTAWGFSNPSDVIKLDALSNPIEITANNQRFALDFTAALANKPVNADAIIILRSFFTDPDQAALNYAEGSWFVAVRVKIEDLELGNIAYVDVIDGELGDEVSFDNDAPGEAEWVTVVAGDLVLVSCSGRKTPANPDGGSPGPFIFPSRRGNRDAFPATLATPLSPPDTIIGFLPAVERLFLMTRNSLPVAVWTQKEDYPLETRAFWEAGFASPFGLCSVNNALYGFTSKGPTRSITEGDPGTERFDFAAAVEEITRDWYAGYVHVAHDPANEYVVFIYSAAYKNEDGWWVSLALPFSLRANIWMPVCILTRPDRDMIVCGTAKVGGHLQLLAGGRTA